MNNTPNLITDPSVAIADDPKLVLDELSAVLRKHGCILQSPEGQHFVLAKIFGPQKALALAQVRTITPTMVEWRGTKNPLAAFTRKVQ